MQGLRLLVVRPLKVEDSLTQQLKKDNCIIHQLPVMAIQPVTEYLKVDQLKQTLELTQTADIAIFISQNAVNIGLPILHHHQLQLPTKTRCLAVGKATATALGRFQLEVVTPETDFSSEGLLVLPILKNVTGTNIVLIKGEGGRTLLQEELIKRGANLSIFDCYRRVIDRQHSEAIQTLLQAGQLDVVVIHSGELLDNLFSIVGSNHILKELPVLVPGQRVANKAKECGFKQVIVSRSALADDMASALQRWYSIQS